MTAVPVTPHAPSHRSTFVTVVAWLVIGLSGLATLGALLSVVVLATTPVATVNAVVNDVARDTAVTNLLPAPYRFMLYHARLVAFIKLVWWAAVLAASIGVLQRREWGRRAFVVFLAIEIVLVVVGLFMGQSIAISLATKIASSSPSGQVPPGMGSGIALAGLLEVAIVALLVWLLYMFGSARVREEFASMPRAA